MFHRDLFETLDNYADLESGYLAEFIVLNLPDNLPTEL